MGRLAPPHTTPIPNPYVHMTSRMRRHRISGARRRMAATGTEKRSPIDTISRYRPRTCDLRRPETAAPPGKPWEITAAAATEILLRQAAWSPLARP